MNPYAWLGTIKPGTLVLVSRGGFSTTATVTEVGEHQTHLAWINPHNGQRSHWFVEHSSPLKPLYRVKPLPETAP